MLLKLAIELGPLLVFFGTNAAAGIYAGTAAFMAATLVSLVVAWFSYHKLPIMPLVSGVIVLVFGGLTLYLRDETFIKLKPTIVYTMFAVLLVAGLLWKKPMLELLFGPVFTLTEEGWRKLTIRWALFFAVMAVRQRARMAQRVDRRLGQLQGLRLSSADVSVRHRASAADAAPRSGAAPSRGRTPRKAGERREPRRVNAKYGVVIASCLVRQIGRNDMLRCGQNLITTTGPVATPRLLLAFLGCKRVVKRPVSKA